MKVIDLGSRLKSAFGYTSSKEAENLKKLNFSKENGGFGSVFPENDGSFEDIKIIKSKTEMLHFGSMMTKKANGVEVYAPPPICSFSKSKNLIITEIDGTDNEVVERYGDKTWNIKIQGILVDMKNHQYPKQEVIKLREFFDVLDSFIIESEIFQDLGILNIYFTDIEISGVAGYADTVQYTLSAKSVRPVEFFQVANNN